MHRLRQRLALVVLVLWWGCAGSPDPNDERPVDEACPIGFDECDGDPQTLCETSLQGDLDHCSACGVSCQTAGAHQVPACQQAQCVAVCETGFADCNGDPADGCEVDIAQDEDHCGGCNLTCPHECLGGVCQPFVVAKTQNVEQLVVDATHLFFTLQGTGSERGGAANDAGVARVPREGGQITVLSQGGQTRADGVDVYGDHVYWGAMDPDGAGGIWRVAKAGGVSERLYAGPLQPLLVAVDESGVYWTQRDALTNLGELCRVPHAGGPHTVVAPNLSRPRDIKLDETHAYWASSAGTILRVDKSSDGTMPVEPVALAQNSPIYLTLAGSRVFWANIDAIMGVNKDGSGLEVLVGEDELAGEGWHIESDALDLVWHTYSKTDFVDVQRLPLAGGRVAPVASRRKHFARGFAIGDGYAYWTEQAGVLADDDVIYRAPIR